MGNRNIADLTEAAVKEVQVQSREHMGRGYASILEVWAVLRWGLENAEQEMKNIKKLHGELWEAIRNGNADAEAIELEQLAHMLRDFCTSVASLAGEAQRAVEELK